MIEYFTNSNETIFSDTSEHFENGVRRLLQVPDSALDSFVINGATALSKRDHWAIEDVSETLSKIWKDTVESFDLLKTDVKRAFAVHEYDTILGNMYFDMLVPLAKKPNLALAVNSENGFGILLDATSHLRVWNSNTKYDDTYFEGSLTGVGYGNIGSQLWRLEKSKRQVEELTRLFPEIGVLKSINELSFLDIGSGYGHFLAAVKESGGKGLGLDISEHAAKQAYETYGVLTNTMTLADLHKNLEEKFDVVTMWDYVEHPDDPLQELRMCHDILNSSGVIVIKTPNINAIEFEIFGSNYHSLKAEHIHYFSQRSLTSLLESSGFEIVFFQGNSHLLKGFANVDICKLAIAAGKESDLLMVGKKI
jgi:2-polyprenyl-3-methyl-5-hydroxy-6-metoxy-1,4-benzoquinol methylase